MRILLSLVLVFIYLYVTSYVFNHVGALEGLIVGVGFLFILIYFIKKKIYEKF